MLLMCQLKYHLYNFGLLSVEALALKFCLFTSGNGRGFCYTNISLLLALSDGENSLWHFWQKEVQVRTPQFLGNIQVRKNQPKSLHVWDYFNFYFPLQTLLKTSIWNWAPPPMVRMWLDNSIQQSHKSLSPSLKLPSILESLHLAIGPPWEQDPHSPIPNHLFS